MGNSEAIWHQRSDKSTTTHVVFCLILLSYINWLVWTLCWFVRHIMECMLCTFCDNMSGNWHIQHSCSKALIDIQCISYIVSSVIKYTNFANQHCVVELILWKFCLMCIHVSQAAFNVHCVLSKQACFNQVWACIYLCWLPFMACIDYKLFPLHCYLDKVFKTRHHCISCQSFYWIYRYTILCDDVFYSFFNWVGFRSVLATVVLLFLCVWSWVLSTMESMAYFTPPLMCITHEIWIKLNIAISS